MQEGPVNALRNPFSPEHWVLNGLSNTVSDLLWLDEVAHAAWTIGNWCRPLSERLWAGAKLLGIVALQVFGGWALGKLLGMAGRGLGALFKRLPAGPLSKIFNKIPNCFVAGTLIHTARGSVPIEQIRDGEKVLSYNEQTRELEYQKVVRTFVNQAETFLKITVAGESEPLTVTLGHPFYVHRNRDALPHADDEGEWRLSKELQAGDLLKQTTGEWQPILSIEQIEESAATYNFEVENNHNYFVGESGLLVHNQSVRPPSPALKGDAFHPDVAANRLAGELGQLRNWMQSNHAAATRLGFDKRIAAQKSPFPSHGQEIFTDGGRFITRDVDSHIGGAWKMFDRRGNRVGTFDELLNFLGK